MRFRLLPPVVAVAVAEAEAALAADVEVLVALPVAVAAAVLAVLRVAAFLRSNSYKEDVKGDGRISAVPFF